MLLSRFLSNFPGEELPVSVLLMDERFFGVAVINKQDILWQNKTTNIF